MNYAQERARDLIAELFVLAVDAGLDRAALSALRASVQSLVKIDVQGLDAKKGDVVEVYVNNRRIGRKVIKA